jgi:hypothetical protein
VRHRHGSGSIAGTILGGLLLGLISASVLIPLLVALLLLSPVRSGGTDQPSRTAPVELTVGC